jgi:AcrR family transcriptional regulator
MATEVKYAIDRRAEILKAAREVLAEKGLDAAKVSEIVARAGVAQGTFYLYFPSKTSVVLALVEEMSQRNMEAIQEAIAGASSLYEVVDLGVRASFAEMARNADIARVLRSRIGLTEIYSECEKYFEPLHHLVADMLRAGMERGEVDPDVNPELSARLVSGVVENASDYCFVYGFLEPNEELLAELVRFVQRALGVRRPAAD